MNKNDSSQENKKYVTIIAASNRPHNMKGFLENLEQTLDDPSCIEVLVKIDDTDTAMKTLMEEAIKTYSFEIRYIATPRLDGYYTLHLGYQQLFEMSNKDTYYIFPVNEEVRFKTKGWDTVLRKYEHFFKDDLFRLKISRLKYRNYYSIHECGPTPENYPFMTRKWVELAGGLGDCWGPDGWYQYIDYHLGQTEGLNELGGIFRSVPIQDILIGGEEAGKELTSKQVRKRSHRIFQEWWRMYSTETQYEFRRIASRMFAYVWANHHNIEGYQLIEDVNEKKFTVIDLNGAPQKEIYYRMSPVYIKLENFRFLIKMMRYHSLECLIAFIFPSYGPKSGVKKFFNSVTRSIIAFFAILFSFFTIHADSSPKQPVMQVLLRFLKIGVGCCKKMRSFVLHRIRHEG